MTGFFFDARFINAQNLDGVSRFALGLIQELKKSTELKIMVSSTLQQELIGEADFVRFPEVTSPLEIFTALKLNRLGAKVVFSPMQTTSSLGKNFRLILTLHDLIYYRHRTPPKSFNPLVRVLWYLYHLSYWPQRMVLNAADAIVTVSRTSKDQMLKARLTKRPIEVIYNASDFAEPNSTNRSDQKTIVYMGSFIGYKNVETVIRAAAIADLDLALLSRISPKRKAGLSSLAREVGARVQFLNGVTDAEYRTWLLRSRALVSASLDEGFGIPVVEAMSHGTPVVLSDLPIFREVAGDAGLYFEATDAVALAARLKQLEDKDVWAKSSELGLIQSRNFSWAQSSQKLLRLMQRLSA